MLVRYASDVDYTQPSAKKSAKKGGNKLEPSKADSRLIVSEAIIRSQKLRSYTGEALREVL
jgi:hypothetical protein